MFGKPAAHPLCRTLLFTSASSALAITQTYDKHFFAEGKDAGKA